LPQRLSGQREKERGRRGSDLLDLIPSVLARGGEKRGHLKIRRSEEGRRGGSVCSDDRGGGKKKKPNCSNPL